jgi:hypothetical protein
MIDVNKRMRLSGLLAEAAELEHSLVCQYLFMAFSMKRHADEGVSWAQLEAMRRWEASILVIARQEMEHLGAVANLLTAIGETPVFVRPPFPTAARAYPVNEPSRLQRFGPESLARSILFEKPAEIHNETTASIVARLGAEHPAVAVPTDTIAALYREIRGLVVELGTAELFIGPPSAQFTTQEIVPIPIRGVNLAGRPVYDVELQAVNDQASALAVIDQITTEGEGGPEDTTTSHFARLLLVDAEFAAAKAADPEFGPARAVVEDPGNAVAASAIVNGLVDLFDVAYGTTVMMLMRYFFQTDETPAEVLGLQQAVFFPMMTTVIRPLGELLTTLPLGTEGRDRAGPAFRLGRNVTFLPHRESAWQVLYGQLAYLATQAAGFSNEASLTVETRQRLALMGENLSRIAAQFAQAMAVRLPAL